MIRLASDVGSKEPKGIHLLVNNGMISAILDFVSTQVIVAGIAKDDNTRFSKAGKPDFSNAQSISDHLSKWFSEPLLPPFRSFHSNRNSSILSKTCSMLPPPDAKEGS